MEKATILIVEDNNIVMLELKDRLFEMGYNVVDTASSGDEAIEKAGLHRPDLIMMDIRIKGEMDGIDAAAEIKKKFGTPVIYLTAHTDEDTIERAKHTEPYGYIIKPFEEREIRTTIEMALYKYSMEQRLKESEHWLSSTLKSIGDALIATDPAGTVKLINHVGEEITGWNLQDAVGRNINEVFIVKNKDDGIMLENPVDISLRQNDIIGETDKIIVAKDGREIPIDYSSAPINYGDEIIAGVVLVFRDVTEKLKAREIIEQQQIFLRTVIDTDPNYISVKDPDGKFELANKAVAEAMGTTPNEMVGKYDREFFSENEIQNFRETEGQAIDALQEIFIPEEKLIDSKGKVHLLQTFKRAIYGRKGNDKLVLSVGSDITDLKNAEKALRENEERINTLLKAIPDTVLRFNRQGFLLDYHAPECRSVLLIPENPIGKNISEVLGKEFAGKIIKLAEKSFETGQIQVFEFHAEIKNAYYEVRIVENLRNEFIVIIKDITNLKQSQVELKAINESKDKFFSIIAHDLRSPFSSLLSLTEYIAGETDGLSTEEIKSTSKSISSSARVIFNLLENLLQWSRVQTGRIEYDPETIDINKMIKKILPIYASSMKSKDILLSVEVSEGLSVFADSNMVEIIFRNIISNAIKFTPEGGTIKITSKENEKYAEISIADTGVGIKSEVLDQLLKIDKNISTLGTQNERGSGLGLILCKEFIGLNGGKLTVKSKQGEGSTFAFSLPKKQHK